MVKIKQNSSNSLKVLFEDVVPNWGISSVVD